jgi:hypothetical protein
MQVAHFIAPVMFDERPVLLNLFGWLGSSKNFQKA